MHNDPLQPWLIRSPFVEAHMVEAVPHLHRRLSAAATLRGSRVHCHRLAVSRHGGRRTLFYVAPEFAEDHPEAAVWKQNQIAALSDKYLRVHIPNRYVASMEVDSRSPRALLQEIGLAPADLDLLVVDTEGFDGEIVLGFLEVSRPKLIVHEHNLMPEGDRAELLGRLRALDYVTWTWARDHVAVQGQLVIEAARAGPDPKTMRRSRL